jgi:hypothetical protein
MLCKYKKIIWCFKLLIYESIFLLVRKFTWTLPEDSIHKDGLRASGFAVIGPKDLNVEFTKRY